MAKIINLKCDKCNEAVSFKIGASAKLSSLKDVLAHIVDPKESERLLELYLKISQIKSPLDMSFFSVNPAECLANIKYDSCSDSVDLFDTATVKPVLEKVISGNVAEQVAASHAKWQTALSREGIVAFEAMYFCPKHKTLSKGIFLQMRWMEDKKERFYSYVNKCDSCSTPMVLVDDCNMGFCHESLPTIGKCPKCNGVLYADSTSFKV